MRQRHNLLTIAWLIFICLGLIAGGRPVTAAAQPAMVTAVLFYSPECPHCHDVMNIHLPPLVQKYPGQLDIVGVNVDHTVGSNLYQAMLTRYNVPDERIGVPTLVVGDTVLVGSVEIPEQFPAIVERALASGGVGWPDIPGLQEVLAAQPEGSLPAETAPTAGEVEPVVAPEVNDSASGPLAKFMEEPIENGLAVLILLGMVASVFVAGYGYVQGKERRLFNWPNAAIPVLSVVGLAIAGYLSYSYLTDTQVVCGPSGGCNRVQDSPYAYLFGVVPVGILGMLGYLAILETWVLQKFGQRRWRKPMALAAWGFAWFGILFTIYLTFLEPFVIGASCLWCLGSAVIMTLIFLATTGPALATMRSQTPSDDIVEDDVDDDEEDGELESA